MKNVATQTLKEPLIQLDTPKIPGIVYGLTASGRVLKIDTGTLQPLEQVDTFVSEPTDLAVSPTGEYLIVSSSKGGCLLTCKTNSLNSAEPKSFGNYTAAVFSLDGKKLLGTEVGDSLTVVELTSEKVRFVDNIATGVGSNGIQFFPRGNAFTFTSVDQGGSLLMVYQFPYMEEAGSIYFKSEFVTAPVLNPDATAIAVAHEFVEVFKPVCEPYESLEALFTVDKMGRILDVVDRDTQPTISPWSTRPAFNSDGNHLYIGRSDGEIMGWDIVGKKLIYKAQAHAGAVLDLLYLRDKNLIISSGADGTIKTWRFA